MMWVGLIAYQGGASSIDRAGSSSVGWGWYLISICWSVTVILTSIILHKSVLLPFPYRI